MHERTGYPLLGADERAMGVLANGVEPTCSTCWWCKGGHWGAPFPNGDDSIWMDARCEYRYLDLLDQEYKRDPDIEGFGPGYKRDHQCPGGCGQKAIVFVSRWAARWGRTVGDLQPEDERRCRQWWSRLYPRLGVGNHKPDHLACTHWRDRRPEEAKLRRGERAADTLEVWEEFDAATT